MVMKSLSDAFDSFLGAAAEHSLATRDFASASELGSRVASASRGAAEMRLIWTAGDSSLQLQISHGPADDLRAGGWLNLYSAHCPNAIVAESETQGTCFSSALEYGFELLCP
ncbi:MAG: hypothetical protein ACJ8IK_20855 [Burkholderiaceae bacterium]